MADDALLLHHQRLLERVAAFKQAWARRAETPSASVAQLMSSTFMGETLSQQVEKRLLEARREIDNQIARYAGTLAAGIAILCRSGDTDAIERKTQEMFLGLGKHEDNFESKLAELTPLVETYARLSVAVRPVRS
jgi:hypothetical protein